MRLSKSQFIRGLQCNKSLWLYRHRPELRTEPDEALQALFDSGTDVGVLAQGLFPGGEEIIYDYEKFQENIVRTRELIESGVKTIYEATFLHDDVLVMVDILHKKKKGWEIYEVKASTKLKPVHENDVAVQYYVVSGSGLKVSRASLVHINNQYTRLGDLDINALFTMVDLTELARGMQANVQEQLRSQKEMISGAEPQIDIGPHCSDPYDCDFQEHCWQHVPEYSIFDINGLYDSKKFELYRSGVLSLDDIPSDYSLSKTQRIQVDGTKIINKANIKKFLKTITGTVGFLDFETFMEAVPLFDGQRPYQQIPFQYSLHVGGNGSLDHFEFLGELGSDPRQELARRLIADAKDCDTILVYNQAFENRILRELAEFLPDLAGGLEDISSRIIDLMKPFQAKDYYVREMKGSYSIKSVLPALVPEMNYADLGISGGGMAMQAYSRLQALDDPATAEQIKKDLLKYCEMDTLAMVKILEKLQNLT